MISVDPSSPFTRARSSGTGSGSTDHFLDPGVFIRSMGTRGHLGGLAEATLQAALILDAAGKDVLFLETVGTGQSEVEIVAIADTVVLALMPGSGDSIQALKAGIMEIPDVIAVNKRDHPAAKTMVNEVRSMLALDRESATGSRPSSSPRRCRARASTSSGRRSRRTVRFLGESGLGRAPPASQPRGRGVRGGERPREDAPRTAVADDVELRRLLDGSRSAALDPLTAVQEIMETGIPILATRTHPTSLTSRPRAPASPASRG